MINSSESSASAPEAAPPTSLEDHLRRNSPDMMAIQEEVDNHDDEEDDDMSVSFHDDGPNEEEEEDTDQASQERDEVKEIEKMSKRETNRVRRWRVLVTLALLGTACAVTIVTHRVLSDEQQDNFRQAYNEYSATITASAIEQQRDIRNSMESFAHQISAYAQSTNATWPYFTMPLYESYAEDILKQSRLEVIAVAPYLRNDQQEMWTNYSNEQYEDWVVEGHMIRQQNLDRLKPVGYHPFITRPSPQGFVEDIDTRDYYFPFWSFSPAPATYGAINWNMVAVPDYAPLIEDMLYLRNETVVSRVRPSVAAQGLAFTPEEHQARHSQIPDSDAEYPHSFFWYPIHENIKNTDSPIVALTAAMGSWDVALRDLLPTGVEGIFATLRNTCNQTFTYEIRGPDAFFRGEGDLHDGTYDEYLVSIDLNPHSHPEYSTTTGHCMYSLAIYPSETFEAAYQTNTPRDFAIGVAATFALVALFFLTYDIAVERRNNKIVSNAAQSNAIVTSMFPSHIRDQVMEAGQKRAFSADTSPAVQFGTKARMKSFLTKGGQNDADGGDMTHDKPMADLFLDVTVLFADISGFTAWASVREPSQVFQLLESVYGEFDKIAKKSRVFKVETVGDCYVAACGIPDPRRDHAVRMARFAAACLRSFKKQTRKLDMALGPDTSNLGLRIGMHCGNVVAGILRGERSRFQLFGDTMNTTARLEATTHPGKIQVSKEMAQALTNAGKGAWLRPREDGVDAKGKGELRTFWLQVGNSAGSVASFTEHSVTETGSEMEVVDSRTHRLIEWNVETLLPFLKTIMAHNARKDQQSTVSVTDSDIPTGETFLEEVKEIIELPHFNVNQAQTKGQSSDDVQVPSVVVNELRNYITCIASLYRDNSFHSFEHASHVTMSTVKLLSRIVAPSELEQQFETKLKADSAHRGDNTDADVHNEYLASLHDHTFGITSDPLTQFACIYSALIHDVDHTGVPNNRLVIENPSFAARYKNRSVAEQNSLDLSWTLFMDDRFSNLRKCLVPTREDFVRFRELVVNSVLATDIVDKDLKTLRNKRWEKAFAPPEERADDNERDQVNRKATIVIEHLIQASDISHTMQHWHVYRKWNENLFEENYKAYKEGRAEKDPAEYWAKGEIGFFDFYIIPLAKKLKDCGVFGVSSGEFLDYAMKNREEWEAKGVSVTAEMVEKYRKKYG